MTYIKKIHFRGFKSFAKPLDLEFGKSFSTIIGPNGSGKSNLIDGITFVLGKSSAKSMRAEKSANLIYNGGKTGSPMKEAEVSMFFDNIDNVFPLKCEEVKISRIVRDNGNSIYKINDETRTRQQVIDLLSAANIDPDGHNIIQQGDVIQFTEMHNDERREIIEEVSGISIYEDKKQKSLLELQKVESKLAEADIILTERSAYLRELKKERDQALKYRELEKNIKSNKATYLHLQIKEREEKRDEVDKRIKEYQSELEKINKKINDLKESINHKKQEIENISKEIEDKSEIQAVQLQKEIENTRTSIIKNSERLNSCKLEMDKIQQRASQLQTALEDTEKTISHLEKTKIDIENKIKELESKEEKTKKRIEEFKSKHGIVSSTKVEEIEKEIEKRENDLSKLQEKHHLVLQEKYHLEAKIFSIDEKIKAGSDIKSRKDIKDKKEEIKLLTEKLNRELTEISALSIQISKTKEEISKLQQGLSKLKTRQIGIKEAIFSDLALKRILSLKKEGVYGTIGDLGKVDSKYALALEVAAGPRIKSIVVDSDKTAAECIEALKKDKIGIATFLPLNKMQERPESNLKGSGIIGSAINLITFDPKFKKVFSYVFGSTLIVENVETARKFGIGRVRMVTLEGDLFEPSGVIIGGYRARKSGIGFQEKETDKEIISMEKELEKSEKMFAILEKRRSENEDNIKTLREKKYLIEGEIIVIEKSSGVLDISMLEKEKEKLSSSDVFERNKILKNQIDELNREITDLKNTRNKARSSLKDLSNPEVASSLESLEQSRLKAREEIIQSQTEIKNISVQISNIYNPELEKTQQIIKQHEKEFEDFKKEASDLENSLKELNKNLKDKEVIEEKFQKEFKGLFEKRNRISLEIQKQEQLIYSEDSKIKETENKVNNASISRAKIIAELEGLQKEFEPFQTETIRRSVSLEELKLEIKKFEQALQQMGNVNLRALEIYDEIEKEYSGLLEKKEKLSMEKNEVLNMIEQIDSKKRRIFMKAFNVINDNFKRIFVQLSAKGEAFLELENPEDPLSAGLDIKVRLSGNKFLDIKSLSGGEKTLTALAFIFAIQEVQPASFYLLDEVDAALDKTNSDLLSRLIKKYSETSQYIVISHNDTVITEAEYVYGVTMQQNGISKVISLKV